MKGEERKYERRNGDGDINYQLNNLNVVQVTFRLQWLPYLPTNEKATMCGQQLPTYDEPRSRFITL